jgi:hypothetical protein
MEEKHFFPQGRELLSHFGTPLFISVQMKSSRGYSVLSMGQYLSSCSLFFCVIRLLTFPFYPRARKGVYYLSD